MRMTTRGRVTIPKYLRDQFGLGPGAEVEFWRQGKTIFMRKAGSTALPTQAGKRRSRLHRGRGTTRP
jgi:AbrB family looped-hinge helix DNA binding protein